MSKYGNRKKKHNFWQRVRFKYKLSIINENTLAEVFGMRVSWFYAFIVVASFAFILILVTAIIIIKTPIHNYLPGYLDSEVREQALRSAIQIDSLERKLNAYTAYLDDVKSAIEGKPINVEIETDTLVENIDPKTLKKGKEEEKFVEEYREKEKYSTVSSSKKAQTAAPHLEKINMARPIKGVVIKHFSETDPVLLFAALPMEAVMAVSDGTVSDIARDSEGYYTLQIIHNNGFMSIYKNLAAITFMKGQRVTAGQAIGIMQKKKTPEKYAHLSFELRYQGKAVAPQQFISF